jgi:hypothetical protein
VDRKLIANVQVDGVWYRPGDTVPADIAGRITNPKVWEGDTREEPEGSPSPSTVRQPPRKGPGSGGPAWIEFAASKGVTDTFDSKDALISHLEERGLIGKE